MISLQQIQLSTFCPVGAVSLALHRTSLTTLVIHKNFLSTRKKDERDIWGICGEWEVLSGYKILSAHSLESNNCFLAILVNSKSTQCVFLDLSCQVINIFDLEPAVGVVAADVDQRRKDIALVTSNKLLKSFSIRLVNSYKSGVGSRVQEFHVILRYQVKLYEHVSSAARQVCYQEVPQTLLVLAVNGDISCWDSASLEILWQIDASRFMTVPQRLAADRFGSDFAVLCAPKGEGADRLEFWSPPKTFAEGNAQSFQRYEIPLKGKVLNFNLETIGSKYGTLLLVILNNRKAQLYSVTTSSVLPLCQLAFTGAPGAFSSHVREMYRLMDEHTANHLSVIHKNCSLLPGVTCFTGSGGLPGCDFTSFASVAHDYCILSFHFPSTNDVLWQEASEACAHMDADATDAPPVIPTPLERLKTPGGTVLDTISTLKSSMDRSDSTIYSNCYFYAPLCLINCLKSDTAAGNNRYLQLIAPKSLLVVDHPTEQKQVIRKITRNGFSPIYPVEGAWNAPALQVSICNVAYRAGMLVLITSLKEGFAFNLRHTTEEVVPLRMEIEVRPQAYVTALLVADVFVKLSPEYLVKCGGDDPHIERNGMIGSHVLTMVGDSDGKINFALSSLTAVLHQGTIRAHDAPVSLIVCTGDASRPLWRLNSVFAKEGHLVPATAPGSAIVSVSESGEMKVWQPLFAISGTARARHTQLLSIYQLSWRISGLMSLISTNAIGESGAVAAMSANMDPTCTTLMVGQSDGALSQWPVPGLIDSGDGKVQSANTNIWMNKKHSFSIDDVRIWTHLPDSSVHDGPNGDWKLFEPKDKKYALVLANDSRKQSVTYTLDELRKIAEGTSMTTCSSDKTIVVWKFIISKAVVTKDARGNITPTRHMVPQLCHVLNFSGSPMQGLCYPLIPSAGQQGEKPWRVTCIVGGIVVNALEGNSTSVFASHREKEDATSEVRIRHGPKAMSMVDVSSPLMNLSMDSVERDDRSVSAEDGLPVVCAVHRLQKTVIAMSRQSPAGRLSWEVFALWQTELPQQPEQHIISIESLAEILPTLDTIAATPFTDSLTEDRIQSTAHTASPSRELQSLSLTQSSRDKLASPSKHSMSLKPVDVVFSSDTAPSRSKEDENIASHQMAEDTQLQHVVRGGVRMVVPKCDLDVLNEIAPEDKSKRYTVDKRLRAMRNGDETMSVPTDPVLSIRPPSPPRSPLKHTVLDGSFDENQRVLLNRSMSALTDAAFSHDVFRSGNGSQTSSKRDQESSLTSHSIAGDKSNIMLITDSPLQPDKELPVMSPDPTQHSVVLDMSTHKSEGENHSLDLRSIDDNSELSSVTPKGTHDIESFIKDELMSTPESKHGAKPTVYLSKTRLSKSTTGLPQGLRQPYRSANNGYTPGPNVTKYKKSPKRKRYVLNKNSGFMMTAHKPVRIGSPVLMRGCDSENDFFDVEDTLVSDVPEEERFPEGYYYKLPTPRFVRMSPQGKRRRYRDMQNALRAPSDSDDEELMSYIEFRNPEEHFNAADRSLWARLDEEARANFLAQKEAEHRAMMEETHQAFREMTMTEDTDSVGSFIDNTTEAEARAPAVTMEKIMGWGKIRAVSLLGITAKRVTQLFADATKSKIDKVSEAEAGLGEFTKFAANLNKLVVEIQAPPEITLEVANVQHDMTDVYLESNKAATAWVIVTEDGVDPPYPEDFDDVEEYRRRPGIVQVLEKKVLKKKEAEFNIFGLKPKTTYHIYGCAQHDKSMDQSVPSRMTDMMILDTHERLVTPDEPPEVLEIEWSALTDEMQATEAKAAIYDGAVQETAKIDGLTLPTIEDINHRHTTIKTSPHLKKWHEFVSWWTDDDMQLGFSDVRSDFLFREAVYASRDGVTIEECEEAGYLTFDESKLLTSLVASDDVAKFSDHSLYIRFRSWLKGGRVVERQLFADPKREKQDEEEVKKIKAARLTSRMEYLKERIASVEKCIEFMSTVVEEHKSLSKKNLSINDLEKKRGQLKPEDVTAIMASKKLTDLCALYKVDINAIRPSQLQLLTGIETFVNIDEEELMADEPPQMVMLSLPGTDKRPLKAWAFCSEEEKDIEVRLASMISSVIELAVDAGLCVPDIEDINIIHDSAFMPLKYQRFQNFKAWYCGKEGTATKPTEAIPSLQRILFADWEKNAVFSDATMVDQLMGVGNYGRKDLFTAISNKYEIEVNAPRGLTMRISFLKRMVKQIGISRRSSMQRLLWPSCGPGRMTSQYLFPRMGIVTPQLEEAAMRFNPYPSTKKESYTVKEILAWYTAADLMNEDKAMLRAEAEGRRMQEYMDWLAKEQERRIENRKIMLEEDATSHQLRLHVDTISVKPPTPLGKPRNKNFSFDNNLPGRYDYLQETRTYEDGSGINNEDEVADVIDKMRQDAEDAIIAARELKRIAAEERRIKDEEERIRQEKLERDQRIEENKERLKRLRAYLENLKLEKKAREESKKQEAERVARVIEEESKRKARQALKKALIAKEINDMKREQELMYAEDIQQLEIRRVLQETSSMEHEDIRGLLMREDYNRKANAMLKRIDELADIYEEFQPFQFRKSRIRVPGAHLDDENIIEDEVLQELQQELPASMNVKWKMFLKQQSDVGIYYDNEEDARRSTVKVDDDARFKSINNSKVKTSLSQDNLISQPLLWRGPSAQAERKYGKLQKKERLYTPTNPDAAALLRDVRASGFVLPNSALEHELHSLGISNTLMKTMSRGIHSPKPLTGTSPPRTTRKQHSRIGTADMAQPPPILTHTTSSVSIVNKLSSSIPPSPAPAPQSPSKAMQDSISTAVMFQPEKSMLAVDVRAVSPSKAEYALLKSMSKAQSVRRKSELAMASLSSIRMQQTANYQRGKGKVSEVIRKVKDERKALRDFIVSNSIVDDKFYVEACKPIDRDRPYLDTCQDVMEFRKSLHIEGYELPAVEENPAATEPEETAQQEAINDEVSMLERLIAEDLRSTDRHTVTSAADSDIVSMPDDNTLIMKYSVSIPEEPEYGGPKDMRQHSLPPPFYRKTFGVVGEMKHLCAPSPVVQAKESSIKDRPTNGDAEKELTQTLSKSTLKSRHSHELTSIKKMVLETKSPSFSATDVNFRGDEYA